MTEKKQIGKILLRQRALSPEQLERALAEKKGGRLASRLAAEGTITDLSALKALSEQHGIPGIDLGQICLRLETLDLLPREIAEKHLILPVLMRDDRLFVATANPRERKVLDELEFVTGKKVYPYVALESSLEAVIEQAYSRKARGDAFYVGAHCPQEILDKLGIGADGEPLGPAPEPPAQLRSSDDRALHAPGVVVDDEVRRLSTSDDIEERDLEDMSPEDSVVGRISDPPANSPESPLPPPLPGAQTILVVDDEVDIRRMLTRLLSRSGYRVLEADRGVVALRLVKEHTPDLIVLDAMLPEVHGFDIARRIKGSKRYGSIPIVMVSAVYRGWRYAEDLRHTLGVDDFIEKPFTLQDVLTRIQGLLGRRQPSPPPADAGEGSSEIEKALTAGIEAYKAGHLDEAIEHLKYGLTIDPLAFRLRFQLGLLYGRKNQVFEAVSELETAVSLNPQHFPAVKNLAILYQKAGFRNKAVETWERALALAPDDATRLSIREHLLRLL
jgi:DNA-binding response OmpR family regulator